MQRLPTVLPRRHPGLAGRIGLAGLIGIGALGACDDGAVAPAGDTRDASETVAPALTYYRDIAPILQAHCTGCHTAGGVGPFVLDELESVRLHAPLSLGAMQVGQMPPWMPDRECRSYLFERGVSDAEVATFGAWIDLGLPAGDVADAPTAVVAAPWSPTDVVPISKDHVPSAALEDDYHCFVLDKTFPEEVFLTASQVVAGSSQVHHVLVYALGPERRADVDAADAADPGPGYSCFGGPVATGPGNAQIQDFLLGGALPNLSLPTQIGAWVPGSVPLALPDGVALRIRAGSTIVAQVHYNLSEGAPQPDTSRIELALTHEQPTQLLAVRPLAVRQLTIPAGAPEAVNSGFFQYFGDAPKTIITLTGHMHLLGEDYLAEVVRKATPAVPECALSIPRWDFHWQQSYRLRPDDYITLADGDGIRVTCTYDNSAANQAWVGGVQRTPEDVSWGEGTHDEMCILYYQAIEPFAPVETVGATLCASAATCVAECGATPSIDCVFACQEASANCQLCALREGLRCSQGTCIAPVQAAAGCFMQCLSTNVMLGSNVGRCMASTCGDAYAEVLGCLDPPLAEAGCRADFEACGVVFPAPSDVPPPR